jgi:DNA-directed RNA polymerase subunit RPC12/RpoP
MENNPEIARENINRYLCGQCGANMIFDPKVGKLACPYCAHTQVIQTNAAEIAERDFYEFLRPETQDCSRLPRAQCRFHAKTAQSKI